MTCIDDDCQIEGIPLPQNKTEMKTFILKWDPDSSAYSLTDFQKDFPNLEYGVFRWTVEEPEGIRSGDNFYLVKTGRGNCGIVMKGFFVSDPYSAERNGDNNKVVDLRPTYMFHPDNPKGLLTLDDLRAVIPGFPWEDNTSGLELSSRQNDIMDFMWCRFLEGFDNSDYDGILADRNRRPIAGIDDAVSIASEVLYDHEDITGEPLILQSLRLGLSGDTPEDKIRGFLRNVIDFPDWGAGSLRERGFSEAVIDGLVRPNG